MSALALPTLFAIFVWWIGTGLILHVAALPRRTYKWSMAGAVVVLAASLAGLHAVSQDTGAAAAYAAFGLAVAAWGWVELSFLTGWVTGPRPLPCPPGATGWGRVRYAIAAILHHELLLIATGLLVVAATLGQPNQIGAWTFLALWALRLSAKLNLFLGVRVFNDEFLPPHLAFLASYFRRRTANPLLPLSIGGCALACWLLAGAAVAPEAPAHVAAGAALLAALLALGLLEHLFMTVALPIGALWGWRQRSRLVGR